MPDRFMEIAFEDDGKYAVYVVDKRLGRVKLLGKMTYAEAMGLALTAQEDFGAIIDRTIP